MVFSDAEAEYTRKLQRPFIPIWMQRHYKPDGWLGFLLGEKFYVDFAKYEFNKACAMLMEQIYGIGQTEDGAHFLHLGLILTKYKITSNQGLSQGGV